MKINPPLLKTLSALVLLIGTPAASGIDFVVNTFADESFDGGTLADESADGGGLSLREAIGLANASLDDGDTVTFDPLAFVLDQTITLTQSLTISDDLAIDGSIVPGLSQITLTGGDDSAIRLAEIDASAAAGSRSVVLTNLSLQNGQTEESGGALLIRAGSEVTLESGTTITNCSAVDGGGILNEGVLTIDGTTFNNNIARGDSGSGGAIFNAAGGALTISNAVFENNLANRAGGAIEDQAGEGFVSNLTNVNFSNNNAGASPATASPGNGGAIHITGSSDMVIIGGSATGNLAAREGGAYWNGAGLMTITDSEIAGNSASGPAADDGGGGIFNNGGDLTLTNVTLTRNIADGSSGSGGGLLSTAGAITISDSVFAANIANRAGGGIELIDGSLDLINTTMGGDTTDDGNIAGPEGSASPGNGGALHITGRTITTISGGTISFNQAASEGGGLWNQNGSSMSLRDGLSITDNTAFGNSADNGGGGIFNNGGLLVVVGTEEDRILIARNQAIGTAGSGGGLFMLSGNATVVNTDFTENVAYRAGGGIEDATGEGLSLALNNVTFTRNNAGGDSTTASPGNGGALHITGAGDVTFIGGTASENLALSEGGGLWNGSGTLSVIESDFTQNRASGETATEGGGALFNNGGTLLVTNSTISNNFADGGAGSGGGIFNESGGNLTVIGGSFDANLANRAGGAIEDNSGADTEIALSGVTFTSNNAGVAPAIASPGNGGAIHITGPGNIAIRNCLASNNVAALEGGAYWNGSGTMLLQSGSIDSNTASGPAADDGGGAIFNNGGILQMTDLSISNNVADGAAGSGGGIFNFAGGNCEIINSSLSDNIANRAGGGVEATVDTTTSILNSTFTGNIAGPEESAAPGNGGAFHLTGAGFITATESSFTGNQAANEGGGLWNSGTGVMTLSGCTISGGDSPDGGGLFQQAGAPGLMFVSNSTVSGNNGVRGGGILIEGGTVSLTQVTVATNTLEIDDTVEASFSGGISSAGGILNLVNTVSANNALNDLSGSIESSLTSLVQTFEASSSFGDPSAGNLTEIDPELLPLSDNGGPTLTHLFDSESPLYNAGTNSGADSLATDQRGNGFPRIYAGAVDIGAVEIAETSFTAWADQNFTDETPIDQRQPDDNPDGDSRNNAIEFLTGSDPENGSDGDALTAAIDESGSLAVSYDFVNDRPDGSDGIETSPDLMDWSPILEPNRQVTSSVGETDRITITLPSDEPKLFGRIFLSNQ